VYIARDGGEAPPSEPIDLDPECRSLSPLPWGVVPFVRQSAAAGSGVIELRIEHYLDFDRSRVQRALGSFS
jgi:hypothetical protein